MDNPPIAVVLGSSPIMMLWALHYHRSGYAVEMMEKRNAIGGAWYTKAVLGFDQVEPGYHIIENRPLIYQFLRQHGVAMHKEKTWAIYHGLKFSYALSQFFTYFRRFVSTPYNNIELRKYHWGKVWMSGRNIFSPFYYPKEGALGMVQILAALLSSKGIKLSTNVAVDRVVVDPRQEKPTIFLRNRSYRVDKLIMSSRAHAPIFIADDELAIEKLEKKSISVLLKIHGKIMKSFSCVRILRDPIVIRVRNVGVFSVPRAEKDINLLCVQVRYVDIVKSYLDQVLQSLKRNGLLDPKSRIIDYYVEEYISPTISDPEIDRINRQVNPSIEIKKTTDLGNELQTHKNQLAL